MTDRQWLLAGRTLIALELLTSAVAAASSSDLRRAATWTGGDLSPGRAAGQAPLVIATDEEPAPARRPSCRFASGARATETLGMTEAQRRSIPITHTIVLMQENRSFDHYFGRLAEAGQPLAEPLPLDFTNRDRAGRSVRPFHLPTTCLPHDPPHQWQAMHAHWNAGRMDGFVVSAGDADDGDGRWAMGTYDQRDLPFYYWLASTFALGDRYFAAAMGGTWPNRQFLYTGVGHSLHAPTAMMHGERSLFDVMDEAMVPWGVYTDGPLRQDCIGWRPGARGARSFAAFQEGLRGGTLPPVSFLDPAAEDEHPPADVQRGERWARKLYDELVRSPLWPRLVLFLVYDEGGGFFDHVPPPAACPPRADRAEYDRYGVRVPFIAVSPWARAHAVSHTVYDHTSILRFIELLNDLPALSARDANAAVPLDLFDFERPRLLAPPTAVAAGRGGCKRVDRSAWAPASDDYGIADAEARQQPAAPRPASQAQTAAD